MTLNGNAKRKMCSNCKGSGEATCPECKGRRKVNSKVCFSHKKDCPACLGTGEIPCPECNGTGERF